MKATTKIGYGVGQLADGVKQGAFVTFLFFYYNQVLGLSGSLAGTASLLALMIDAITDPMVGQISDNWRSRWGRRHPFMVAGSVPFCIAVVMLFNPPDGLGQTGLFWWLLGGAVSVRLMLTLFFVPHLSLGSEMVRDYHDRTSLIGYRVFFSYLGSLVVSVVGFAVFFPPTESFSNGMLNPANYGGFGLFVGLLGTGAMLWCIVSTFHVIPSLKPPAEQRNTRNPLFAVVDVFTSLREKAFRVLFFGTLMFNVLAGVSLTLLVYVATYVFGFDSKQLALLATSPLVGIMLASTIAQTLSRKFDKRLASGLCSLTGAILSSTPMLLFLAGSLDNMEVQDRLWLVYLFNGAAQGFFIAFVILLDSMLSDTADEHEVNTGRREEGLFFAARSFATKASYGLGSFFAGIALDIIAFPRGVAPADVATDSITRLAIVAGPLLTLLFVFVLVIIRRYPLDAARYQEIEIALQRSTAVNGSTASD
ncbi:MFS transporter [Litorivivens sp.]|uniref:MFS transporter n=2 Tax=Litorivivens sp. TaxID=2020868 RepID=UPI003567DFBB